MSRALSSLVFISDDLTAWVIGATSESTEAGLIGKLEPSKDEDSKSDARLDTASMVIALD